LSEAAKYTLPTLLERDGVLLLRVRVQPAASREGLVGVHGDALKVAVTASPERGKANAAVSRVIAGVLGLRGSRVQIRSGAASRDKWLELAGLTLEEARARLRDALRPD
jgi:hypothetical protein